MAESNKDAGRLVIVGSLPGRSDVLSAVAQAVREAYPLEVSIGDAEFQLPGGACCWRGTQLLASEAFKALASIAPPTPGRIMAIVSCDITVHIMQYVLGEAEMGGTLAIISTAQLGRDEDTPARAARLAVHETGHLLDLVHCEDTRCPMFPVSSLLELDARGLTLCPYCQSDLDYRLGDVAAADP